MFVQNINQAKVYGFNLKTCNKVCILLVSPWSELPCEANRCWHIILHKIQSLLLRVSPLLVRIIFFYENHPFIAYNLSNKIIKQVFKENKTTNNK